MIFSYLKIHVTQTQQFSISVTKLGLIELRLVGFASSNHARKKRRKSWARAVIWKRMKEIDDDSFLFVYNIAK